MEFDGPEISLDGRSCWVTCVDNSLFEQSMLKISIFCALKICGNNKNVNSMYVNIQLRFW